jgi:hypothetical protein
MNGTIIAIKIRKVKANEILVADLLPYRIPWINESKNAPVIMGIKAVIEGVSDPIKLQRPSISRTKEFIILIK